MAIPRFLAMTAAEIRKCAILPARLGWMACHFSPYGVGLSNLPKALPRGSLLMVDDITPIHGHDPDVVANQLRQVISDTGCAGVLLDFQRGGNPEAAAIAAFLSQGLPCPVGIGVAYGKELNCPVCLPPVPCHTSPAEHLSPWQGREIWLELAPEGETITLTAEGATIAPLTRRPPEPGFLDTALHCRYQAAVQEDQAVFTLWRTRELLNQIQEEAESLGVTQAIGLWQEWSPSP